MPRRRYKNPPVDEAVCEFRFESDLPWDLAIPGLLYGKLSSDLPKRQQVTSIETVTRSEADSIKQQVAQTNRLQLLQKDEKAVVQVGPNLLSVHRLAPYPGWEEFLPLIVKSLQAYQEVAAPKGFQRITVRYINRLSFDSPVELEDYFEFYPYIGQGLPQDFGSFISGVQVPFEEGRDVLQIQLRSAASDQPDIVTVVLDLSYFLRQPETLTFEGAFEWIENAHGRIEDAFEGCLKDALRERFEEVRQ